MKTMKDILVIEPFCGGSHGQLIKLLSADEEIGPRCELCCLPAKKWHWRARTSSLYLSQVIPFSPDFRVLFTSSVLNLAELVALRPDLSRLKKILYFHENQLVYPVRKHQDRDFQYGYNQILSSLVADAVIFNSKFNMESFLSSLSPFMKLIPDHRPKNLVSLIGPKCKVMYFPLDIENACDRTNLSQKEQKDLGSGIASDCLGTTNQVKSDLVLSSADSVSPLAAPYIDLKNDSDKVYDNGALRKNDHRDETEMPDCHFSAESRSMKSYKTFACSKALYDLDAIDHLPILPVESHDAQDIKFVKWNSYLCDTVQNGDCLHIVWPHRWEYDKDPDSFFAALLQLEQEGLSFNVSVVGETFSQVPTIFATAQEQLGDKVKAWGFQTRQDYLAVLDAAHVVVSTAHHEFFGVSMLEAVSRDCYPLCPNRLVYPEIYPKECLYATQAQLVKRLRRFCHKPQSFSTNVCKGLIERFTWKQLQEQYRKLVLE